MTQDVPGHSPSALRTFLTATVIAGTCLVILMAMAAFGPFGFGFGMVIAILLFGFMLRRNRFSLRTFLVLTTLFGIWLGLKFRYDRKLQQTISTVANAGGHLAVQHRSPNFPGIWLDNTGITDDGASFLRERKNIQILGLANAVYFGGKPIPNRVQNHISDDGIQQLRGLKSLVGIELDGTDVTDKCIDYLIELPNLRWINLNGTQVTGVGMARFSRLKNLAMLEVNGCPISHEGVNELSQPTNVTCFGLYNSGITDADLDVLNAIPQIDIVRIAKKDISQDAVKRFPTPIRSARSNGNSAEGSSGPHRCSRMWTVV